MTRALRRPIFVMAAMVIAAMWFASAVQAGAPTFSPVPAPRPALDCDTRLLIVSELSEKYGEVLRGAGWSGEVDVIYEVWASEATGTWTIIATTQDGFTCVMAVGEGWQDNSLKDLKGKWL